jgi:CRISPR-associated endonuclease/helicase Cas3
MNDCEQSSRFLAHVCTDASGLLLPHGLPQHLRGVAELAAARARPYGADWARLAGLWHDLGKYAPQFQSMIRREATVQ